MRIVKSLRADFLVRRQRGRCAKFSAKCRGRRGRQAHFYPSLQAKILACKIFIKKFAQNINAVLYWTHIELFRKKNRIMNSLTITADAFARRESRLDARARDERDERDERS